jgi:hypothetical protein
MKHYLSFVALAAFAMGIASGADAFYVGTWKIATVTVAPWWTDSRKPDPAESKTLVGQVFEIRPKQITGPRQVACKDPRFQVKEYSADMLFQGMFGEMRTHSKSADPAQIAAAAGFRGTKWKTLETGCDNEVEFHFLDDHTAAFGLNNYIYTLKKQ